MANPGSIVVTEYTHRLTDGYFEFNALGETQVKGVEEPLKVYEVTGAGPLRTRLQVSARRGLSRFVGRHSEMDQLQDVLEHTKDGHGQIVGVLGEPGFGEITSLLRVQAHVPNWLSGARSVCGFAWQSVTLSACY